MFTQDLNNVLISDFYNMCMIFILGCPRSPPVFYYFQEITYLCVCVCVCSQPWLCRSEIQMTVFSKFLFYVKLTCACLFICLAVRTSVCRTALLYDPTHFPLTFHFLCSHPVSGTTALCKSVTVQSALAGYYCAEAVLLIVSAGTFITPPPSDPVLLLVV